MSNKKLLYFSLNTIPSNGSNGPAKKMLNQIEALEKMGFNVHYAAFDDYDFFMIHKEEKESIIQARPSFFSRRIAARSALVQWLRENKIDFFYMRFEWLDYILLDILKIIKKHGAKIILEIPTYPFEGEVVSKNIRNRILLLLNRICSRSLKNYVDLIVTYSSDNKIFGIPAVVIENGVNLETITEKRVVHDRKDVHLLALAYMRFWQGYDRVLEGMKNYYDSETSDNPKVFLHMVGDGPILPQWKVMSKQYGLDKYVIFHGIKHGKELDDIFDLCDIGIAPLGCHRKGVDVISSLKVREYCAKGLPFIYSATEKSLNSTIYFTKQISHDDTPLNINQVITFWKNTKDKTTLTEDMRAFVKKNYSWENQFQKVFGKFEECIFS